MKHFPIRLKIQYVLLLILVLSIGITVYGLRKINAITYDRDPVKYYMYETMSKETYTQSWKIDGLFLNDINDSIETLENDATLIVKVEVVSGSVPYGYGRISHCNVLKTYKGEATNEIVMYSLAMQGIYFDGSVPLQDGKTYILLLKQPEKPTYKGAYMPISTYYGIVPTHKDINIYQYEGEDPVHTWPDDFNVYTYDHCFSKNTPEKDIDTFKNTVAQIQNTYGD